MIGVGVKIIKLIPHGTKVNSQWYKRHILQQVVVPFVLSQEEEHVFMQDGARAHTANECKNYLRSKQVKFIEDWPPRSPDLNPLENLWALVAKLVSERGPRSQQQLEQFVLKAWNDIPQATVDRYVESFQARKDAVRANRGI
jgi:transposase